MTTPAEDSTVEDAFEALLAGRTVPEEAAGLVAFTAAVRATATSPGRPSAALAELLATGRPADRSSPSPVTAEPAPRPRGSRRRRRSTVLLPALLTKFLATGALAKAATGAGVAVVAFTGAGVVGVLPDPVQDTFSSIVGTETVSEDGEIEDGEIEPGEDVAPDADGTTDAPEELVADPETEEELDPEAFDAAAWAAAGPAEYPSFGAWVREAARHGGVDGQVVREWARSKGMSDAELASDLQQEGLDLDVLTDDPATTSGDAATTEVEETAPAQERPGNRGAGNGNGGRAGGSEAGGSANGNGNGNGNGGGRGNGRN